MREIDEHPPLVHARDQLAAEWRDAALLPTADTGVVLRVVRELAAAQSQTVEHVDAVVVGPELHRVLVEVEDRELALTLRSIDIGDRHGLHEVLWMFRE